MKLICLVKALHLDFTVKFTVNGVENILGTIIGVKQGDILAPILFTFFIAAAMITWKLVYDFPVCIFRTNQDVMLTGRKYDTMGEDLPLLDSEYADDTGVIFDSRESTKHGTVSIITHFERFGMEVHTGLRSPRGESKTEILFCSKPLFLYDDPDTFDDIDLTDMFIDDTRYIPVVDQFTYLGSIINRDCTDGKDVDSRILKASHAFGLLRNCLFSSTEVLKEVKGKVYRSLILPTLLYVPNVGR